MAQEIERKFLVTSDAYKNEAFRQRRITQGYLCTEPGRTVRVRIKGDKGFITIKGAAAEGKIGRYEWEKEIPVADAEELLELCKPGIIDKKRYEVKSGRHIFEVDEFHGENQGLVIAEIELAAEDEQFEKPAWLGREVTAEKRYYNSKLLKNPYKRWKRPNEQTSRKG
ncbi:MAG TPA: CYTH domain-containing protein [Paludibacter sp.]|nr:CYTH domain-containing protein [Paludibacter sp.]